MIVKLGSFPQVVVKIKKYLFKKNVLFQPSLFEELYLLFGAVVKKMFGSIPQTYSISFSPASLHFMD